MENINVLIIEKNGVSVGTGTMGGAQTVPQLPQQPSFPSGTVAQAVWTQLTSTEYGAGTMGEYLKDLTPAERIKFIADGELPIY